MAETSIEWCDYTFNPWIGCQHVHAGCTQCYAEAYAKRYGKATWGPNGTRVKTSDANWRLPHKWNAAAEKAGERRRVFCASLADVFEDWSGEIVDHRGKRLIACEDGAVINFMPSIPHHDATLDDLRRSLFALIDATPHLDWLLLTKRPENVRRMWRAKHVAEYNDRYRANVMLGTSPCNQETADKSVPELMTCHDLAGGWFLSCEPLLGPIDLRIEQPITGKGSCYPCAPETSRVYESLTGYVATYDHKGRGVGHEGPRIEWVIVGGESGSAARPCDVNWISDIVRQCREAGVPCFVKQLGSRPVDPDMECGVKLRDRKGGDPSEWRQDLRVRQFPQVAPEVGA